jgi:hypothetical protein
MRVFQSDRGIDNIAASHRRYKRQGRILIAFSNQHEKHEIAQPAGLLCS